MNVEGHCYSVTECFLDGICNLIGWHGVSPDDQGSPDTNVELVTSLIIHLARNELPVRLGDFGGGLGGIFVLRLEFCIRGSETRNFRGNGTELYTTINCGY